MLNTHGRFEAAAAAELVQALADRPQDVAFYYTLVQSRHLPAADVPTLIARMRQAQAFTLPAPARLRLHPALARALHQQGAYAEAETELLAADRLRARHTLMNRPALRNLTDQTIASFTPDYLAGAGHRRDMSQCPMLVLGLPRSGTTLLSAFWRATRRWPPAAT